MLLSSTIISSKDFFEVRENAGTIECLNGQIIPAHYYIKSLVQELAKPQVSSSLLDLVIHDRLVSHKFTVECT